MAKKPIRHALREALQASVSRPALKPMSEAPNRQIAIYAAALAAARGAGSHGG